MTDGNEFLMRGGTPSVKFPVLGSTIIGAVTKPIKVTEVRDPATKEVKRWPNGDPKMQVIIELQTELRESDDDNGERTLWAKGQMQNAIRDAVREAGAKGILPGGVLQVTWSSEKKSSSGLQPQKIYSANYWPPEQVPQTVPAASAWEESGAPQSMPAEPMRTPPSPAMPQSASPHLAEPMRTQQYQPQAVMGARPVSTPPAQAGPPQSFLDKLRQTTANQQAYHDQRQRGPQGQPQDEEPPF